MQYFPDEPSTRPEDLLARVVAAYLEAADEGVPPTHREVLDRYPRIASELEDFFAGQEAMGHLAGAARAEVSPPSPLGGRTTLGDHELLGEIGRGGMGVVYRARERRLGREVALKVISSGTLASHEEKQRFLREARAAAQLDHPGIVPIHEVGEEDGLLFFTMKLVEGGSLAASRDEGRPPERSAEILEQVARAVHHAHERGVLHRDLKPANILLDCAGAPLVSDFGLARPLDRESSLTATGSLIGTASYMAPEQASASHRAPQRTADVYSLGTILYELLTGAPPFRGATPVETLRQAQSDEPRRPSQLSRAVPRDLETICLKCLEKSPERRYATALDLADDLRRFAAGEPIAARAISRPERAWRWGRRHPAQCLSAVFLIVLAIGSTLAALLLLRERAETRSNLAEARLAQARTGALSRRPGQRLHGLRAVREAAAIEPSLALRNAAISCLSLVDLEISRRFATGGPSVAVLALDSTLDRAVSASWGGETWIRELSSGRELSRFKEDPDQTLFVRFSPDDRLVLRCTSSGTREGGITVWRWEGTPEVVLRIPAGVSCQEPSFAPDGTTLAIVDSAGSLNEVEIASGATVRSFPIGKGARRVDFDASGTRASVATIDGRALVVDLKERKKLLDVPGAWISACRPMLDVVAVAGFSDIELWSIHDQRKLRALRGHESQVVGLDFSPVAEILISTSWDGTTRLWSLSGRELLRHDAEGTVHFGRDGSRVGLVFTDRSVAVGELLLPPEARTLATSVSAPRYIVFAPDESWLAHGVHGGVKVLELSTGRDLVTPAAGANLVVVEPGGKRLITSGAAGLLRWPVEEDLTTDAVRIRVGPPQLLSMALRGATGSVSLSADGRRLVVGHGFHRLVILDIGDPPRVIRELSLHNVTNVALSPDGALASAGPLHGTEACVWDVASGAVLRRFSQASSVMSAGVGFSPDGRWFFFSSGLECSLFRVGDWERPVWTVHRPQPLALGTPFSFSRDGALLAMTASLRATRLVHTATGEELATLEEPDSGNITDVEWSPSNRWVAVGLQSGELKLWDLLAIRRELSRLGLDWNGPPELRDELRPDPRPLRFEVDLGPSRPEKR